MSDRRCRVVVGLVLSMACSGVLAQERKEHPQPELLKNYVADQTSRIERDIADLIRQRNQPGAVKEQIELRIDLRIVQRHLTQQLLTPPAHSDAQAVIWLRHKDLGAIIAAVDAQPRGKTAGPATSKGDVRQLTFKLQPLEEIKSVDTLCAAVGPTLMEFFGENATVVMRPPVQLRPAGETKSVSADQLGARASQLTVSAPLRQQLVSAAAAARAATGDEAKVLTAALQSAVDLAVSMQGNVGLDAATRADMETQIGEAIALYSDPRLRDAGQKRFDSLGSYRKFAGVVSDLSLPRETVQALQPALAYARGNPEEGAAVLKTLDAFSELETQTATLSESAGSDALGRAADAQAKQFLSHRIAFFEACEAFKGGTFAPSANDLGEPVKAMRAAAERANQLRRLRKSLPTVLELKPRPTGGLEKRLNQQLAKYETDDVAQDFVRQLDLLATGWAGTKAALATPPDAAAVEKYAGQSWPQMETRLRAMASDAANALAAGGTAEGGALNTLVGAAPLLTRLRSLSEFEAKLSINPAVTRWADCGLTQEKIDKLLDGFRGEVKSSVDVAFARGNLTPEKVEKHDGLIAFLRQLSRYGEPCAKLPEGNAGLVGRFTTPSDKAPFALERYASFVTDLQEMTRLSAGTDMTALTKLEDRLLQRMKRDAD